jgi:hypothetical protein
MNIRSSKILFWSGIAVFVLAKLYLIVPMSAALAAPRLGDDSLVYLWKGKLSFIENAESVPALNDIALQRYLHDDANEDLRWMRSNVVQRTLGHMTPSYNPLAGVALKIAPDMRLAFLATEIVGLILMTIGMAWLLLEIVGPAAAGIALLPLAFAIMPNQGIYSFIPSTFALSCSLILWAYLWRRCEHASATGVGLAALVILGLHPIAKLYVAITPALYWLRLGQWSAWRGPVLWRITLACGLAISLALILPLLFPSLRPPPSNIMGGLNVLDGVLNNLDAVMSLAWDPVVKYNLPWAFMLAGAILFAPRLFLAWPFGALTAGLVALLGVSLLFWLPGYPGELFSRVWVLFVLLTSAIGARFMLDQWARPGPRQKIFKWLFVVLMVLSALVWVFKYVPAVMNWRAEVIDEPWVAAELKSFPEGTTLLYAETNVALQASLLLGADRLGTIAYPMLAGTPSLDMLIRQRHPAVIVIPPEPKLNSLAQARYKWFLKRRQGLFSGVVSHFTISRNQGMPLGDMRLLVEGDAESMHWEAADATGKIIARGKTPWSSNSAWMALDISDAAESVHFTLPDANGWILGISAGASKHKVYWPWESGWAMTYGIRGKSPDKNIRVEFSTQSLLARIGAKDLMTYVDQHHPVQSDVGGMMFLRTNFD